MSTKNLDFLFADNFVNVNNGMIISRETLENASKYLNKKINILFNRARGLHYGKPRRNAIQDKIDELFDQLIEIDNVWLLGKSDEWIPSK